MDSSVYRATEGGRVAKKWVGFLEVSVYFGRFYRYILIMIYMFCFDCMMWFVC